MAPILEAAALAASRGKVQVIRDIDLQVRPNEIVAIVGPNGAGKTTLVETLVGLVELRKGHVAVDGSRVARPTPPGMLRHGIVLIPQGCTLFPTMTVADNILLGGHVLHRDRALLAERVAAVLDLFPGLRDRLRAPASSLSGGERQMVAIGRALIPRPRLLILDEPTQGLAPIVAAEMLDRLRQLVQAGEQSVLLVEQNLAAIRGLPDRYLFLGSGEIRAEAGREGLDREGAVAAYFGSIDAAGGDPRR